MIDARYTFATATTEPPTGNQVRFDQADPLAVTRVWARYTTDDAIDLFYALLGIPIGSTLWIQDRNDHTRYVKFQVRAAPLEKMDYAEIPVIATAASAGLLGNNQAILFVLAAPGDTTAPPLGGPLLVSLPEAKEHLHIPLEDLEDDAAVERKLRQASDIIARYLKAQADPTWDASTTPPSVQSAVLLMLGHLWVNRGDAAADAGDLEVWDAIRRVLERQRDPALA